MGFVNSLYLANRHVVDIIVQVVGYIILFNMLFVGISIVAQLNKKVKLPEEK